MFRRGSISQRPFSGSKDHERIFRERQRQMMYDSQGNVRWAGVAFVLWQEVKFPARCIVAAAMLTYAYQSLVLYACVQESQGAKKLDKESEEIARSTGKLRADRFLVKPRRQIDDPDMYDMPSHSSKGEFRSRLIAQDDYSSGRHHDEFSRSK